MISSGYGPPIPKYRNRQSRNQIDAWASYSSQELLLPLLSDCYPKCAMSKAYGAFRDDEGVCERKLYAELREDLRTGTFAPKIRSDFLSGPRSGVSGTPTFSSNGNRHEVRFNFDDLAAAIEVAVSPA